MVNDIGKIHIFAKTFLEILVHPSCDTQCLKEMKYYEEISFNQFLMLILKGKFILREDNFLKKMNYNDANVRYVEMKTLKDSARFYHVEHHACSGSNVIINLT